MRDNSTQGDEISSVVIKNELKDIASKHSANKITFAIIGGEPLIRDDIIEVGSYASSLGYRWGITTNGMLLTPEKIIQLKEANLATISISLDGIPQAHNALRNNPNSYQLVFTAIEHLLEDVFYNKFDVICCVNKLNINSLDAFLDSLIEIKVPAVRFTPIFARGRASMNNSLMLDKSEYKKMLSFISLKRKTEDRISIALSEEGYWGPEWECVIRDGFHYCASGVQIGSILYNGKITGCPSVSRKFIEGDISESSFSDIWKNCFHKYRSGRKDMFEEHCGNCEQWILCEGGGFHMLDQKNTSLPFCCLEKIKGV
jgi:radical SAM protein with 4Fe4S-binding SPASM domain